MAATSAVLACLFATAGLAVAVVGASVAHAQPPGTVDVVVDYDDERVEVFRIAPPEGATGLDLLRATVPSLQEKDGFVCSIGDVGCPATDCMCRCPSGGSDCRYWAYYHGLPDGGWETAQTGAGAHRPAAGSVEGWVWSGSRPPITATLAYRDERARAVGPAAESGSADASGVTTTGVYLALGLLVVGLVAAWWWWARRPRTTG